MKDIIIIALGAGLGGSFRHLLTAYSTKAHWNGILLANLTGCILMGFILSSQKIPSTWKPFLTVGVLGGLTTFSSFAAQAMNYLGEQKYFSLALYLFLSVFIGILCCYCSYKMTTFFKW